MSFEVTSIRQFDRQLKRLVRKYPSLAAEVESLAEALAEDPDLGTDIGGGLHKIRLAIRSKNRGKSGGARVITVVRVVRETVYLASIYDKSEVETLSDEELLALAAAVD